MTDVPGPNLACYMSCMYDTLQFVSVFLFQKFQSFYQYILFSISFSNHWRNFQRNRDGELEYKKVMSSIPDEMKQVTRGMIKGCDKLIPKGTERCKQALIYNQCARNQDPIVSIKYFFKLKTKQYVSSLHLQHYILL